MKRIFRKNGTRKGQEGFTLVELLVVVTIIGLLVGLISVAVPKAIESGMNAKAKGELTSIVAAVKAYKQEYGQWPAIESINSSSAQEFAAWYGPSKWAGGGAGETRGKELMKILSGVNQSGGIWPQPMNPKQIRFLEGAKPTGVFLDPWGQQYCVKMDVNESGGMEYGSGNAGNENLRMSVIAVSLGKNGVQEDNPSVKGWDDIYSWGKNLQQ